MRVRTLKELAAAINAIGNGYTAVVEKSWTSTDRHPKGVRWRIPGKGRHGTKITVMDPEGIKVMRCDTSETTPVQVAIEKAIEIFGTQLDLDPGELFAVGDYVRVIDFGPLYGKIEKVVMKNTTQAKHYAVRLRNGHLIDKAEPWRIRRD